MHQSAPLQTQRTLGGNAINPSNLPPPFLASITTVPTTEDELERKNFMDELSSVMQEMGKSITKMPIMGYRELDLYSFYKEVQAYGGYVQVTEKVGTWSKIWKKLGNSDTNITDASFRLKRNYEKFLLEYEYYKNPDRRRDDKMNHRAKRPGHKRPVSPSKRNGKDYGNKRSRFPSSETLDDFSSFGNTSNTGKSSLNMTTAQQRITGTGVYFLGSPTYTHFGQHPQPYPQSFYSSSAPSPSSELFRSASSSSLTRINSFSSMNDIHTSQSMPDESNFEFLEDLNDGNREIGSISSDSVLNLSPSSELSPSESFYFVHNPNNPTSRHGLHLQDMNDMSFEDSLMSCQSLDLSINDELPRLPCTFDEDEKTFSSFDLSSWVDLDKNSGYF